MNQMTQGIFPDDRFKFTHRKVEEQDVWNFSRSFDRCWSITAA